MLGKKLKILNLFNKLKAQLQKKNYKTFIANKKQYESTKIMKRFSV